MEPEVGDDPPLLVAVREPVSSSAGSHTERNPLFE